mgnify:CR=1 FL=1
MMKNLKRILVLLLAVMLFNVSCSSDDDQQEFCEDYTETIEQGIKDYSNAYQAYYLDPTLEKCTAFKQEVQNLKTTIEGYKECISSSDMAEYDELIEELNEQLNFACK